MNGIQSTRPSRTPATRVVHMSESGQPDAKHQVQDAEPPLEKVSRGLSRLQVIASLIVGGLCGTICYLYVNRQSVSVVSPSTFQQEGGQKVRLSLEGFESDSAVEVQYGRSTALSVLPQAHEKSTFLEFTTPLHRTPGAIPIVVRQGDVSAQATIELLPPPKPVIASINPSSAPQSGGDEVTMRLVNFIPEELVRVRFGSKQTIKVTPRGATIKVTTPQFDSPGRRDIIVSQNVEGRLLRSARTSFVFKPVPMSLRELTELIEQIGEGPTISRLSGRGVSDRATVTGDSEITKTIGGRSVSFDAYDALGTGTVDLSHLEGAMITFRASNVQRRGTFEVDRNLVGFEITQRPTEQELRSIPVECTRCGGEGKEREMDTFCYPCGGRGRTFFGECADCGGDGQRFWRAPITESRCSLCRGTGKIRRAR